MDEWNTFSQVSGDAAGALVGLLFVAVSIRVDVIARKVELASRAAQTLVILGTALFIAILLSTKEVDFALGSELVVLALVSGSGLIVLDRRAKKHADGEALARVLDIANFNAGSTVLLLVTGVLLLLGLRGGLYILVACVMAELAGGVVSAWLLLLRTTSDTVTAER